MEENKSKKLEFRNLRADEIECRVGQCSAKGLTLLLYKTSRVDVEILNEKYEKLWAVDYKEIKGNLFAGIRIWDKETEQWITRWSCGTESNMEKAKGEDSDALKRSGFRWGIGLALYSAPFIWISANKCEIINKNGKYTTYDKFVVEKISYDENGKIDGLSIVNLGSGFEKKHKRVFTMLPEKAEGEKKQEIIDALKS